MKKILAVVSILSVFLCLGCTYQNNEYVENDIKNNYSVSTTTVLIEETTTSTIEPYVYFYFRENTSNCTVSGNITLNNILLKKSEASAIKIMLSDFPTNGTENQLCIRGMLSNCFGVYEGWKLFNCWSVNVSRGFFIQKTGSVIEFNASVNIHRPGSHEELKNFVRPQDMKGFIEHQREIGFFSGSIIDDIEKIWKYVDSHVSYRYDSDTAGTDYWKLPNETMLGWGDCEDWSNLFVSMARAYDNSIKCYSIMLPSHLGTFCKIESGESTLYGFYDQNTKISMFSSDPNDESIIRESLYSYFSEYNITDEENKIMYAFNDEAYYIFADNEEFIKWAKIQ